MNNRKVGASYEKQAAEFLEKQGYHILERNYRNRMGEIDIIGWDDKYLAFIEVKYRGSDSKGGALEAVDFRKQQRISRTALFYRMQKGILEETPCRFDVVGIEREKILLVKNAFDFCYGNLY